VAPRKQPDPDPDGLAQCDTAFLSAQYDNLRPPPTLTLNQWSERHGVLSLETSAETGRFRAYGYQVGLADAFTDPTIDTITMMKAARVGFTKVLDHAVGYFLSQDPSPILIVQPRVEDAEDYSKTEIVPMLRDIAPLAAIAGDPKAKQTGQTILKKTMLNGASLTLVGANSPGGFRRITVRIVLFDEVDGYPPGAGSEGDQISLGIKRSQTFWNRKIALGSTPTIQGLSRIEQSWNESDQRRYFVPCPHCGEMQTLEWGGPTETYGLKWPKDENGQYHPEQAYYVCRANGCIIEEIDKPDMVAKGEWRAARPCQGHAGFQLSALYSPHVNASWAKLAAEWLEAKGDPKRRQTFINTTLGLPYEDRGDNALNEANLLKRREVWAGEVPPRVALLTAGVDVQDDRVEIEVIGWGADEESWSIAHEVIEGDTQEQMVWRLVDEYLKRKFVRADGREFEIMATCVDSGGHATQQVYTFCKARLGRRIWAIKGESARGGARSPVWPVKRPSARNKQAFRPIIVGVNAAKDTIRSRLHVTEPGPGYMHFQVDRDINYFAQLVSERLVTKVLSGQRFRVWELSPGRANEALDMRVYGYAALCGLLHFGLRLNRRAAEVAETYVGPVVPAVRPVEPGAVTTPEFQGPVYDQVTITTEQPATGRRRLKGRLAGV